MNSKLSKVEINDLVEKINQIETDQILLCVDQKVWGIYNKIFPIDKIHSKKVYLWKAPDGEKSKTMSEFERCLEFFLSKNIHRKSHLVAIGGGAISDLAGFVASSLLRGISWSVIPTTLLSMIDASIGGKVAINSKLGKNLIGSFHLPENIWICPEFMGTLDESEVVSGKGELLKYGFLSEDINNAIMDGKSLDELINLCGAYKLKITEEDFKEGNKRKYLNLGHTIGHAIEFLYGLTHGEAVAWGMVLLFVLFEEENNLKILSELAEKLEYPKVDSPWKNKHFPIDEVLAYVERDKKMTNLGKIDFILVSKIGEPEIKNMSLAGIRKRFEENEQRVKTIEL